MRKEIPLTRRFQEITKDSVADETESFRALLGYSKQKVWADLGKRYRTVILADAGAGKTFEMERQARYLREQGLKAFFIRIEDIAANFAESLEIGTPNEFSLWRQGQEEAWFFLDSIDEARLEDPRAFQNAIKQFASAIHDGTHRAHICISSRPYAWRATLDREMLEEHLPHPKRKQTDFDTNPSKHSLVQKSNNRQNEKPASESDELAIYWLCPLDRSDIGFYANHVGVSEIEDMLNAIERLDLWSMAERPFDLDDLLDFWTTNKSFSNRLDILRSGIRRRLEEIHPDRGDRQPLSINRALDGAQQLAAAVVLSGQPGIQVPEGLHNKIGLKAEEVLESWEPEDIHALLGRGLFNDAIYGAVRIRHREVRDLLTAEWFHNMLKDGAPRHKIEALIFTEQYGAQVIRPRLRPILPWLILFDDAIRDKALAISPEIAAEGGDTSMLAFKERRQILHGMVDQIVKQEDDRNGRHTSAIARIASADLESDAKTLIAKHATNDDAIFFLGRFVWQGKLAACLPLLEAIACNSKRGIYARIGATRAVATVGTENQRNDLWRKLIGLNEPFQRRLLDELIDTVKPDFATVDLLIQTLVVLEPYKRYEASGLSQSLLEFIDRIEASNQAEQLDCLLRLTRKANELLECEPHIEPGECRVSTEYGWLLPIALHAAEKIIQARSASSFDSAVVAILLKAPKARYWAGSEFGEDELQLGNAVAGWSDLNDALFWASIDEARASLNRKTGERLTDDWQVSWFNHYWQLDADAFERVIKWISDRENLDDRLVALSSAFRIYSANDRPKLLLVKLKQAVSAEAELKTQLNLLVKPPISEENKEWQQQQKLWKRRHRERELKKAKSRAAYVAELKADPDRVRNPKKLKLGEWSGDQYSLLRIIEGEGISSDSRTRCANWQALIPEFGEQVALAYRDAALTYWRVYRPSLGSEGANTRSTPYAQNFALGGLSIEADEQPNFLHNLTLSDSKHALRYFICELNGFPPWFERLYNAFSKRRFYYCLAGTSLGIANRDA